ncbi:hypothetical protein QTP70_002701 [Hemibagrus guttatus]|uniref:Uncharacterized protein n=1 Tax=Hemibagrus guttatus TaxID=175788 RepID=A0AAE0UXY1_9TELE|nr:hypothetical protein QTP70_002701 [Hemibagrus guttatus]KAK3554963.1 hypothetical protein QTP86_001852 [Hemibagrus guttatus]
MTFLSSLRLYHLLCLPPPHPDPILSQAAILVPIRWNLMEEIQQAHVEEPPPANCPPEYMFLADTAIGSCSGFMNPSARGTQVFTGRPSSCDTGSGGPPRDATSRM